MVDFSERIVLVTGAAGNLGKAVISLFLNSGATVCALDHKQGRIAGGLNQAVSIEKLHLFENVDVTNRKAMTTLAEQVIEQVGTVGVLVNTVGGFMMGEMVHEISPDSWKHMMTLNVQSFLNLAHAFVPMMVKQKRGKVISVGSRASLQGGANTGAYGAAKSALLSLTESMAAELLPHHIQVNCVLPGTIDTPENREAMPNADFEKWVQPKQVAQVILYLASSASDAVSGVAIPVYGGS